MRAARKASVLMTKPMIKPMIKPRRSALLLASFLLAAPLCSWAQTPPPKADARADSEGFVPEARPADMSAPVKETVPAQPLVAGAYGFIWLAVLVYVATVARRASRLTAEVAALQQRVTAAADGPRS